MNDPRAPLRISFVLGAFGLLGLVGLLGRSDLGNVRAVDVLHLVGSGMCIGGALVSLALYLRSRH